MHPITSHYGAQAHMEDLRREAELYRLTHQRQRKVGGGIRATAGHLLIRVGERILPRPAMQSPTIQTTGSQC